MAEQKDSASVTGAPCPACGQDGFCVSRPTELQADAFVCSYCAGSGYVSIERAEAYRKLLGYGTPKSRT